MADAGGDQSVNMPVTLVTLDGSKSTDDKGIVSYKWVKNENSLAAGVSNKSSQVKTSHVIYHLLHMMS